MPTPAQWQEYAAQRNKYRYGTPAIVPRELPEQPVDTSTKQDSSLIDKARLTLGGIGLDPKAAPLPNETIPSYMGRRLKESYTDTVSPIANMVVGAKEPIGQFTSSLMGDVAKVVRPVPTPLEAVSTPASVPTPVPVAPMLTSLGNGYGVAGANTSDRAGYSNRTYYDPNGNVIGSGVSSATGRGGFGGAATDAKAERDLQARFEQDSAAGTMAANMNRATEAMRELRAAQVADLDGYKPEMPVAPGLDQQKFNYQKNIDANRFLLDKQKFDYQQGLDKQRLAVDKSEVEGKQSARQLERQKYMDEARKTFVNEFAFSDPKAPKDQIAGAVFDISQATGVPTDVVSQFYEQVVKDLKIDYSKGGPKDPMALNKLVATRIAQAYQGQ